MELRVRVLLVLGLAVAVLRPSVGATAVVATSDYIVGTVALPGVGNGDVAVVGTALFVGQGSFGAGSESIARIEPDGSAVTVVTGLNAVGGLAYDSATDRLIFADNGGDLSGAATGDTVYALTAPLAASGSVAASGLSLAPSGTIPFAQAVLPLAGGSVLVGDAAGGGAGRVVKVSGGNGHNPISGPD